MDAAMGRPLTRHCPREADTLRAAAPSVLAERYVTINQPIAMSPSKASGEFCCGAWFHGAIETRARARRHEGVA
jgi:hypothetical protein